MVPSISLVASTTNPQLGQKVTFTATYTVNGKPKSRAPIAIGWYGVEGGNPNFIQRAYSNSSGQLTASQTFNANGVRTCYAWCTDQSGYTAQSQPVYITVGAPPPPPAAEIPTPTLSITSSKTTPLVGENLTITATLKGSGAPVSGKSLRIYNVFSIDNKSADNATGATDESGNFSTDVKFMDDGKRTFYATFGGDGSYKAVTSGGLSVDVVIDPTPYAIPALPPDLLGGEVVYLVPVTVYGSICKADQILADWSNAVFLDTDDIDFSGDIRWVDTEVTGRDTDPETYMGYAGDTLAFTGAMVGDEALKNIKLFDTWRRVGTLLQITSTYHYYMKPVVVKEFNYTAPKDYPINNYYNFSIKLQEFKPLYIEYENLRKGTSPGGTVSDCSKKRVDVFSVRNGVQTKWVQGPDGSCLASTSNLYLIYSLLESWLGRPIEDYRFFIAGQAPSILNYILKDAKLNSCFVQACEFGFAWWSDGVFPTQLVPKYAASPYNLTIFQNSTNAGDANNFKAGWFTRKSSIATDPQFPLSRG